MNSKFILTDGTKAVDLLRSNDPDVWTFFSGAPKTEIDELYAKVSAAFRAFNLKANTVGNMPFSLNNLSDGEEYDNSATWENKVGFLPNPSELFRLDTLSYMATNTIYNLRTMDVLGRKQKGLYHAVATSFLPVTNAQKTDVDHIERQVGSTTERYQYPIDKALVRMWRLDHTTELLPSKNTEAQAIMKSAQVLYYADEWIAHFYRAGGVSPTAIAMKGAASPVKKEDEEKSWNDWLMGIRKWWGRRVKVYNADTLDVKQYGSSVTELKDNPTYTQAIANIAMGTGMPLSLLLSNSANYATAQVELKRWFDSDIVPFCNWLGYEYNQQVFMPLGLYLEFHSETLDPQQEDETSRAQAFSVYMDVITKCPTFDIFIGMAQTLGLELSDGLVEAAKKYYADKAAQEEATRVQTQPKPDEQPVQEEPQEDDTEDKPEPPAKWIPTIDHLQELKTWRKAALQRLKRGEPLAFEYIPHYGGVPEEIRRDIVLKLAWAKSEDDIKAAFDVTHMVATEQSEAKSEIMLLAESINALAMKKVSE